MRVSSKADAIAILAIADQDRPFQVACDASDFAIGCALMQNDTDNAERVVCYQSLQLQPAKRNYSLLIDKATRALSFDMNEDPLAPSQRLRKSHDC